MVIKSKRIFSVTNLLNFFYFFTKVYLSHVKNNFLRNSINFITIVSNAYDTVKILIHLNKIVYDLTTNTKYENVFTNHLIHSINNNRNHCINITRTFLTNNLRFIMQILRCFTNHL